MGIDDFAAWPAFAKLLGTVNVGQSAKAQPIYHPDLVDVGISSACVSSIGGAVYDGTGGMTIAIGFTEYRAPKKIAATAVKAAPPAANDPNADVQAHIGRLLAVYQRTPYG